VGRFPVWVCRPLSSATRSRRQSIAANPPTSLTPLTPPGVSAQQVPLRLEAGAPGLVLSLCLLLGLPRLCGGQDGQLDVRLPPRHRPLVLVVVHQQHRPHCLSPRASTIHYYCYHSPARVWHEGTGSSSPLSRRLNEAVTRQPLLEARPVCSRYPPMRGPLSVTRLSIRAWSGLSRDLNPSGRPHTLRL
jgi:hypothetical protein